MAFVNRIGGKLLASCTTDRELVSRAYQEFSKTRPQEHKSKSINKRDVEMNRSFAKEGIYMVRNIFKALAILLHQGNAYSKHLRFHLISIRMTKIKKKSASYCSHYEIECAVYKKN